jgi:hypothetical protein
MKLTYEVADYLTENFPGNGWRLKNIGYENEPNYTDETFAEGLRWREENPDPKPTWSSIREAFMIKYNEINPLIDARVARKHSYPDIIDQLDMMYHDKKDDTTTWEDSIQAVKDANPKP